MKSSRFFETSRDSAGECPGGHVLSASVLGFLSLRCHAYVSVFLQEPRHLQCIDELKDLNVYTVTNSRKLYGAPVDFTFCVKVRV